MKRNDVILGVLNFFGYQGVRSAWLVALSGHGNMVETHVKKRAIARFSINSRAFPRQPPGHGQVPNDPVLFCFVLFGLQLSVCLWWLQVPLRILSDA